MLNDNSKDGRTHEKEYIRKHKINIDYIIKK